MFGTGVEAVSLQMVEEIKILPRLQLKGKKEKPWAYMAVRRDLVETERGSVCKDIEGDKNSSQ